MTYTNLGTPPRGSVIYPAWNPGFIKVVDQALSKAWHDLVDNDASVLETKDEDIITDCLLNNLTNLRRRSEIPGFNDAFFSLPSRDAKLPDCDGNSIDQMPDITIRLAKCRSGIADDRHDALFFECKVLDPSRGLDSYRVDGIDRFLSGRYAWRMPHAGMLAYVFDRRDTIPTNALITYSKRKNKGITIAEHLRLLGLPTKVVCASTPLVSEIAMTEHDRLAPVVDGKTFAISLRHMWLMPPVGMAL